MTVTCLACPANEDVFSVPTSTDAEATPASVSSTAGATLWQDVESTVPTLSSGGSGVTQLTVSRLLIALGGGFSGMAIACRKDSIRVITQVL